MVVVKHKKYVYLTIIDLVVPTWSTMDVNVRVRLSLMDGVIKERFG